MTHVLDFDQIHNKQPINTDVPWKKTNRDRLV